MGSFSYVFKNGPQSSVAEMLRRFDSEIAPYNIADMERVAGDFIFAEAEVNWKSMRDVRQRGLPCCQSPSEPSGSIWHGLYR